MRRGKLKVLNPCHEDFDAMSGNEKSRFCSKCEKHVHDLSTLTEEQADTFMAARRHEPTCIRFTADASGAPVFRPSAKPRYRVAFVAAVSLALSACAGYAEDEDLASPDAAEVCHDAHGYAINCSDAEPVIPDVYADRDCWGTDPQVDCQRRDASSGGNDETTAAPVDLEPPPVERDGGVVGNVVDMDAFADHEITRMGYVATVETATTEEAGDGEGCPIRGDGMIQGEMLVDPLTAGQQRRRARRARRQETREQRRQAKQR